METVAASGVCPWFLPFPVAAQCVAAVSVTARVVVLAQQALGPVVEPAAVVQG